MSNSVRPHRRQPTRLPRPWDSPSKNTGVGCHFLLQCMKEKSESEVAPQIMIVDDFIIQKTNEILSFLVFLCKLFLLHFWVWWYFIVIAISYLGEGFPGGASGKEPTCQCRRHKRCRFDPWVEKIPRRRAW